MEPSSNISKDGPIDYDEISLSQISCGTSLDDSSNLTGSLEEFNGAVEAVKNAESYINSEEAKETIRKNKITVSGQYKKLNIICSNAQHHAITAASDLELIKGVGVVSTFDLVLMSSADMPMFGVFERAITNVVRARSDASYYGRGPSIDTCLAWLAHAAQCPVSSLIPPGEIFPAADTHALVKLSHTALPLIADEQRKKLAIVQILRVLDMLAACDLRCQAREDRCILLFALSRLILDRAVDAVVHNRIMLAISNVVTANEADQRLIIVEFSRIFSLLTDDVSALRLVMECFRLSAIPPFSCLVLFSALCIHISERAECVQTVEDSAPEDQFIKAHLLAVLDTFNNVMDVYDEDRSKHTTMVIMLDSALHREVLLKNKLLKKEIMAKLITPIRRQGINVNGTTDDAIIDTQLSILVARLEMD